MGEKDLNHKQGNETVNLPKHVFSGRTVLTDPHTKPGAKEQGLIKKTEKGWSK